MKRAGGALHAGPALAASFANHFRIGISLAPDRSTIARLRTVFTDPAPVDIDYTDATAVEAWKRHRCPSEGSPPHICRR